MTKRGTAPFYSARKKGPYPFSPARRLDELVHRFRIVERLADRQPRAHPPVERTCLQQLVVTARLPTAAWAPVSLLIFGLKDQGIYFVVVMSSMPAIAIATAEGILNIPPIYLRAARTLGTPSYAMCWRVIIPASLPSIVTGIKLGWTLGWHGAVSVG